MSAELTKPNCGLCTLRPFCEAAPEIIADLKYAVTIAQTDLDSFDAMYYTPPKIEGLSLAIFEDLFESLLRNSGKHSTSHEGDELAMLIDAEADSTKALLLEFGVSQEVLRHIACYSAAQASKTIIAKGLKEIAAIEAVIGQINPVVVEQACVNGFLIAQDDAGGMLVGCGSPGLTSEEQELTLTPITLIE